MEYKTSKKNRIHALIKGFALTLLLLVCAAFPAYAGAADIPDGTFIGYLEHGTKADGYTPEDVDANGIKVYQGDELLTDENGLIEIKYMIDGEWVYTEVDTPNQYVLPSNLTYSYTVEQGKVHGDGMAPSTRLEAGIINEDPTVQVLKVNSQTGAALAGAHIQILNPGGSVFTEWDSTASAHTVEGLLTETTYTIHESAAPNGYIASGDTVFRLNKNGTIDTTVTTASVSQGQLRVPNAPTSITFRKVHADTGTVLTGAHIQIKDHLGAVVDEWDSGAQDHTVSNLLVGETYTIHESAAPSGFATSTDKTFTIAADGSVTTSAEKDGDVLLIKNAPTSVSIRKVNTDTGLALAGAHLQLLNGATIVQQWDTTASDKVITSLATGVTYTIHESTVPQGYTGSADKTLRLNADGSIDLTGTTATVTGGVVIIENTPIHPQLTVSKTVTGTSDPADLSIPFSFTLTVPVAVAQSGQVMAGANPVTFNASGEATFTLTHNESITFTGIPYGTAYTVTETPVRKFDAQTPANASGTLTGNVTAGFVNNKRTVQSFDLTVSKTVTGLTADVNKDFSFEITFTHASQDFADYDMTWTKGAQSGDVTLDGQGKTTFTLRHGQSITFSDIPQGTQYAITEDAAAGYVPSSSNASGTISADTQASFSNAISLYSISVTKAVSGDSVTQQDRQTPFTFTLNLPPAVASSGTIQMNGNPVTFNVSGNATFTLTDGQSAVFTGIPHGTAYAVAETQNPDFSNTPPANASGTVQGNVTMTFNNVKDVLQVFDLTVGKTVAGSMGSKDVQFQFRLTLTNANADLSDYTITWTKGSDNGTVTLDGSGRTTFTLAHNENIVFSGIPNGTVYTVEETDSKDYDVTSTNATGTISADTTAAFVNTRNAVIPTDTDATIYTIAIAMGAVMAAIAVYLVIRNRKKKGEN